MSHKLGKAQIVASGMLEKLSELAQLATSLPVAAWTTHIDSDGQQVVTCDGEIVASIPPGDHQGAIVEAFLILSNLGSDRHHRPAKKCVAIYGGSTTTIDVDLSAEAIAPLLASWGPQIEAALAKIEAMENGLLLGLLERNDYVGQFEENGSPTLSFVRHAARLAPAQCLVLMWTAEQACENIVARSLPEAVMISACDRTDNAKVLSERFKVFRLEGVLGQLFSPESTELIERVLDILDDSRD